MPPTDKTKAATPVPPRGKKRQPTRPQTKPSSSRPRPGANPAASRRAAIAQQRRRKQTLLALGAIVVVVAVVAVFVVVKLTGGKGNVATGGRTPVPASVYSGFTGVPVSALAAAANNYHTTDLTYPQVTNDPPITTSGKPEVLFIGGEFCPYCATERWSIVLALSKFGTWHNLTSIKSSPNDSSGIENVPTFSFYHASYTSPYFTLTTVEHWNRAQGILQPVTASQQNLWNKYGSGGSIPFLYMNGKAVLTGAEYNPQLLLSGTFEQNAQSIIKGQSALASSVYANAGSIVSDLCRMTGGKPGSVCHYFPKPITS